MEIPYAASANVYVSGRGARRLAAGGGSNGSLSFAGTRADTRPGPALHTGEVSLAFLIGPPASPDWIRHLRVFAIGAVAMMCARTSAKTWPRPLYQAS